MNLRHILLVLSLLAFLSVSAGGVLYYGSLRRAAFQEAKQQTATKTTLIHKRLTALLHEHRKSVATLAGMGPLRDLLQTGTPEARAQADTVLDLFVATQDADVCYVMDLQGNTIASSNRRQPDSFVGQNFAFRPYFHAAREDAKGAYLALGVTSGKRGIYHSAPVHADPPIQPIGVAVIKASIDEIEMELDLPPEDIVLVTNEQGIVFISSRPRWLFQFAWQPTEQQLAQVARARQFGNGPWQWVGLHQTDATHVMDNQGHRYLVHRAGVDRFPGWEIVYLRSSRLIAQSISGPLLRIVGPAAVVLSIMVGLAVLVLYNKASSEIARRRSAEEALRHSEARYRSLYHHTPAMLHSIGRDARLLSVSNYWLETMGYQREEVLGRPLTDFFTAESKHFASSEGIPRFFKDGCIKGVPYRMVKKDGTIMEVTLSAIADRDAQGNIQRSLAVCVDMTERNRAEAALRVAKEALDRYSKELERQVRERTSEISAILTNTPAVVYMKDGQGRYLMVNSRFEKVYGIDGDKVQGKTDEALLPEAIAGPMRMHDAQVLAEGRSMQVEEQIGQPNGIHTYLSVKFPLFEEGTQRIMGVCGIATDITALKSAQEQLRQLSGSIMANQEKERAALARELHDELGQLLTAIRMDAVWLQERLREKDFKAAERAAAICRLVDTTIEEVRAMALRLRPGVLDDLGLVEALEMYTTEFERRVPMACIFTHQDVPAVDSGTATAAYRIAQEALTNVARHADATRAEVRLTVKQGALLLKVGDDGRGFDPDRLHQGQMLGLVGMRERAALVGGTLSVVSSPGRGTVVALRVPLVEAMGNAA